LSTRRGLAAADVRREGGTRFIALRENDVSIRSIDFAAAPNPSAAPPPTSLPPTASLVAPEALVAGRADDFAATSGPGTLRARAIAAGDAAPDASSSSALAMMLAQQPQQAAPTAPAADAQPAYRSFATDAGIDANGNAQGKGITSASLIDTSQSPNDATPAA